MSKNRVVLDIKPKISLARDVKPNMKLIGGETVIYRDNATILFGQPVPWGLNWLITYPTTLAFQTARI